MNIFGVFDNMNRSIAKKIKLTPKASIKTAAEDNWFFIIPHLSLLFHVKMIAADDNFLKIFLSSFYWKIKLDISSESSAGR